MENPLSWTRATRVIFEALREYAKKDPREIGLSQPAFVAMKLEAAGYITEEGSRSPELEQRSKPV